LYLVLKPASGGQSWVLRARQEQAVSLLAEFKTWLNSAVHSVLPKDSLGEAVH